MPQSSTPPSNVREETSRTKDNTVADQKPVPARRTSKPDVLFPPVEVAVAVPITSERLLKMGFKKEKDSQLYTAQLKVKDFEAALGFSPNALCPTPDGAPGTAEESNGIVGVWVVDVQPVLVSVPGSSVKREGKLDDPDTLLTVSFFNTGAK